MKLVLSTIYLFLLSCWVNLHAQIPGMHRYTRFDGYPGTVGYHINQDHKGFIWIGTDNGATCFDGKTFRAIGELSGLRDQEILAAVPDKDDRILLVPLLNNISYYHKGQIVTATQEPSLDSMRNSDLNKSFLDPVTGEIWISDEKNAGGIYHFNKGKMERIPISIQDTFQVHKVLNNQIFLRFLDNRKYSSNIRVFDILRHTLKELRGEQTPQISGITSISERGDFMISYTPTSKKLDIYRLNISLGELDMITTYTLKNDITEAIIDQKSNLWLTNQNGGVAFISGLNNLTRPYPVILMLKDVVVNYVFVDRDHNVWFSTRNAGLYFISARHFSNMLRTASLINIPKAIPRSIAGDGKNTFCIGYQNAALVSVVSKEQFRNIPLNKEFIQGVRKITYIYPNKYLLIGNELAMLRINSTGTFSLKYLNKSGTFKDISIYDNTHAVLAASLGAQIIYIDSAGVPDYTGKTVFTGRTTTVLAVNNIILLGTPNGLLYKKGLVAPAIKVKNPVLNQAHITDMVVFKTPYALVATSTSGLYLYNYQNGKAKQIQEGEKESTNFIRQISVEHEGVYWLSTNKGVKRISIHTNPFYAESRTFTTLDGLPSDDVTDVYIAHDTAYVATTEGLAILLLSEKNIAPASSIYIGSLTTPDSVIHFPEAHIALKHNQNTFHLSLSTIAYEYLGRMNYSYRLEGLDERWIKTENPEISFTALPPGDYNLVVYAISPDGTRHSSPVNLAILIAPKFWQTMWFKSLLVLVLLALIYLSIYRWAMTRKEKQYRIMQQKRRQAELELEAIKAQINPHFIYNCLNAIQFFNYSREYEQAEKYLDLFARLIRNTMKYSRETFITLAEEMAYLQNYLALEQLRFKQNLKYTIEADNTIDQGLLVPAMLIQPHVENALKHGIMKNQKGGFIRVGFSNSAPDVLRVHVEDNGPGLSNEARRPGAMGLYLSGTRASTYNHLFNMNIQTFFLNKKDKTAEEHGTIVELLIPYIKHEKTRI